MEMYIKNRKWKAGRRIKAASAAILLMGLLIGCTNTDKDAEVTKRAEPPKNELTNFKTEDGKMGKLILLCKIKGGYQRIR
ncbi:hypothetical protein [Bacillus infantis]|uniref:hypothetical protein n=1 Tax=Bacillus infantis TaxID=324767 RepID=UPI00209F983E|nr:hypothetical protein [Bacillus infantis]MCP1157118.1 hypothetical protein [Bacillus infantis]